MILLVVDAQKMIVTEELYQYETFVENVKKLIEFMTAEQTYRYYNEKMWNRRYSKCVTFEEALEMLKTN